VTLCVKCGRFVDTPGSSALLLNALRDPLHGFPHANPYDDRRSLATCCAARSAARLKSARRWVISLKPRSARRFSKASA